MQTKIRARNRVTERPADLEANQAGELLFASGDSDFVEVNRSGKGFLSRSTAATAPVIALPTTTAGLAIYNSAPDGGKTIIIDALLAYQVSVGANATQNSIIYVQGQTRVAALTSLLATVRKNNSQGPTTDTVALVKAGGAILDSVTGVAIGWMPIGATVISSVSSLHGASIFAPVNGRLFIAPGRMFGINVMSSHTGGTWNVGMMWHEKQIKLS